MERKYSFDVIASKLCPGCRVESLSLQECVWTCCRCGKAYIVPEEYVLLRVPSPEWKAAPYYYWNGVSWRYKGLSNPLLLQQLALIVFGTGAFAFLVVGMTASLVVTVLCVTLIWLTCVQR